ncbi:MAG TPA: heme ABC exporter ATP-binding protein CcmA [Terriglobia bacterium]|nr:heme ABC exporter ATP-binding protein CcmA [Terriglobia bacterium]
MPETLALDSKEIEKKFGYSFAVRKVTLRVRRGEFVVLFGSNGAGKTTFLKMAAGLMRPTRGSLSIEGFDIGKQADEARRRIGFLSHNTFVYKDLSPLENLKFFCRLYGVPDSEDRLIDLLDRVGLRGRASEPVRAFSRGLQQRVGIARALLHDPSVILLDEPYTGLDAKAAQTLNGMLDEALAAGKTIVLTTHDLDQGLRAATRALILDRGNVVYDGSAKDAAVREAYLRYIQQGNTK